MLRGQPMNQSVEANINNLKKQVQLVAWQLRAAEAAYCLFKPAASDQALLDRLGSGRATLGFEAVRECLHKECVLALMRIWDKRSDALSIERIVQGLDRADVLNEIRRRRVEARSCPTTRAYNFDDLAAGEQGQVVAILTAQDRQDAQAAADRVSAEMEECKRLVAEAQAGPIAEARELLKRLRHEQIAHYQVTSPPDRPPPPREFRVGDERQLLDLTVTLVEKMQGVLDDMHVELQTFRGSWRRIAASFWHNVSGEKWEDMAAIAEAVDRVYPTDAEPDDKDE